MNEAEAEHETVFLTRNAAVGVSAHKLIGAGNVFGLGGSKDTGGPAQRVAGVIIHIRGACL